MRNRIARLTVGLGFVLAACAFRNVSARELTFEDRVDAQAAIERVYYAHQIGTTTPFEAARLGDGPTSTDFCDDLLD